MSLRYPILTTATLALAVATVTATAATAAPSASSVDGRNLAAPGVSPRARPLEHRPAGSAQLRPGAGEHASTTRPPAARSRPDLTSESSHGQLSVAPVVVRVTTPKAGFDWGDAGIGAAAALGISMIALAAVIAITQRRARGTRQPSGGVR